MDLEAVADKPVALENTFATLQYVDRDTTRIYKRIEDLEAGRLRVQQVLDEFPVFLMPGEAKALATYSVQRNWELEIVDQLGRRRILHDLSPEQRAKLREFMVPEVFDRVFGVR